MSNNNLITINKTVFRFIFISILFSFMFTNSLFASADMQPTVFTDNIDPAPANGEFEYQLTLTNNGADDAKNVELNVTIPEGFTFISSDRSECDYNGSVPSEGNTTTDIVKCNFGTVAGNLSSNLNIKLRAGLDTGVFQSDASIYCDDDANTANDTELLKTTIKMSSDLNITKTSLINPIAASGIETYEFVVSNNNGPYKATEVTVTDTLPSGLTFIGNTIGEDWDCSASGQDVTCTYANELDVNDTSSFTFDVKVTTDITGVLTNVATVSAKEMEVNSTDNSATDDLNVTEGTDISISKSIVTNPAIEEYNLTFEVNVTNEGFMVAKDVNFTDTLPSGYTFVSYSGDGWSCTNSNQKVSCIRDDESMDKDKSEIITIVATAPKLDDGVAAEDHTNRVDVNTTTDDPIPSNDSSSVNYILWADQADLEIYKSKSPDPVAVGYEAISTIRVKNNGPQATDGVQVVDVLDENESYDSSSGTDWNCSVADDNVTVTCDYNGTLANGAITSDLSIVTVALHGDTNLSNRACTGGSGGSVEPTIEDENSANDCTGVGILATEEHTDIEVIKTTSDSNIDVNENNFTYTMVVKNIGEDTGKSVKFEDIIPQYIAEYNGRPATGIVIDINDTDANCTHNDGTVSCDLGDMDVNDSIEINVTVTRPMKDGTLTNTANAYSELTGDTNRTNNQDSVEVTVDKISDIELVEKLVTYTEGNETHILAGTEATYTIQVRNDGPSIAKDVNVSDVFDGESYTFISSSATQGSCAYDEENRTLNCAIGDMAYENTQTITIVILPDQNATVDGEWEINNTATVVTSSIESNTTNNDKNQTLKVKGGRVDMSIEIKEAPSFQEPVSFDPDDNDSNIIVYEVIVQNLGPSLATDINFSVHVDKVSPYNDQNLTFLRDTSNQDGTDDGNGNICSDPDPKTFEVNASAPKIYCTPPNMPTDTEYKRYIVYHIENAPHLVSGDVYKVDTNVTTKEEETEYSNNTEEERTTVRIRTDAQLIKTASKSEVEIGEEFTYNLEIINNGPGYSPNTDIEDSLPDGMVLTDTPSSTQGSCRGSAGDTSFTCNVDSADGTLHSQDGDEGGISDVNITVPVKFISYEGGDDINYTSTNSACVSTTGPDTNSSNDCDEVGILVHKPAHIGDRVWLDRDADGIQTHNSNDKNISDIPVYLIDSNDTIIQKTTTDENGEYGFDINTSGKYRVEFNITGTPFKISPQNVGSDIANDSDINASGSTELFTVDYGDNNLTIDAGLYRLVNIGDRVWIDENGDGLQTSGEANVSDVNVTLWYDVNDTQVLKDFNGNDIGTDGVVTTDENGTYMFSNLKPGKYYVIFDKDSLPTSEYVFTTLKAGSYTYRIDSNANRDSGKTEAKLIRSYYKPYGHIYTYRYFDAGIYIPVSIGDYVWHDQNGDGIQDSNEANISDVNVTLWLESNDTQVKYEQNGTEIGTDGVISTDSNGSYLFKNLRPDTYYVKFDTPTGYVVSLQDAPDSSDNNDSDLNASIGRTIGYKLTSGEDNRSVDAAFYVEIKLGDRVWEDKNYNGIQDSGERNVSGVTVELYQDGDATGIEQNTTDMGYLFEHLSPNHTYSLKFSNLPSAYRFTQQDMGSDDELDSDANMTTGLTSGQTPKAVSDDVNLTFDAGIYKPVTIGNYVWDDTNADGIQNDGATGIADVNVTLVMDGVLQSDTITTDANGYYEFDTSYDLKPDHNYSVEFTIPTGYVVTLQNEGSDDRNDSDANATGQNVASTPTMYSNESNNTLDMGLFKSASIGSRVWIDTNGNGIDDNGEPAQSNVRVRLYYAEDDSQVLTDIDGNYFSDDNKSYIDTNSTGEYHFTNLRPGSYYVKFDKSTLPSGYVFTTKTSSDGTDKDSDANRTTGRTNSTTLISGEDDMTWDAGIYIPANIGDRVWLDTNANGVQDDGEDNLTGVDVTVKLYDGSDNLVKEENISDGNYSFTGLIPDDYYVEFTLPDGYKVSKQNQGGDDSVDSDVNVTTLKTEITTLISGENDTSWDMGVYQVASIGDRVWLDTNANGVQDDGEDNITNSDIVIDLVDENNVTVDTITGLTNGVYRFENIVPSSYQLRFTIPDGYVVSPQDVTDTNVDDTTDSDLNSTTMLTDMTRLSSGENDTSWDVGLFVPASIGDRIWLDTNANGVQDDGEGNFTGEVTIELLDENNNRVIDASGNDVNSTTTSTGTYSFTNLIPDSYHVAFTFPDGVVISAPNQDTNSSIDSDVNIDTNMTSNTVLVSGENDISWDAGVFAYGSIGDTVWIDNNGNGLQDDNETLDINVTVNLYDSNDTLIDTKVVEAGTDGSYMFNNVKPNSYYVEFVVHSGSGYLFTSIDEGSDDTIDSDTNQSGKTSSVVIGSGESNITLDAGIYIPATLGNKVWLDANANGIQDDGENGIEDINITLYDENNNSVETTVTDENGTYIFTGITPSDYHLVFATTDNNEVNYVASPQNVTTGADDRNDSDINASGVTEIETLLSGENNRDYDAGLYKEVKVGDLAWSDENGNGIQDNGEKGLANIEVTLFKKDANGTITTIGTQDTNSSGSYLFSNLTPAFYYVGFETPEHFKITSKNSGEDDTVDSDINVTNGETDLFELLSPDDNLTLDAGFYKLATVSGTVTLDTNNDDIGDENLSNVDLELIDENGKHISSATTDSNGSYIFIDVEPGNYVIIETQPSGMVNVSENEGGDDNDNDTTKENDNQISVSVGIGENDVGNDFVEEGGVNIGDRVWIDTNGDGIQDASETNSSDLEDISVNLLLDGNIVATTSTDDNGSYLFENFPSGNYSVEFNLSTLPSNYGVTLQNQGDDDTNDSDANETTGLTSEIYLAPDEDNMDFDMGIYSLGKISGMILEDTDDDDIGDTPMEGVTVTLYDEDGNVIATTVTDENGYYQFTGLKQGVYTIVETQPDGYLDVGETDGDYPDDNKENAITVDLNPSEEDAYNDFIEELGGSIGNYVWYDKNGDGLQDSDETGVNAVEVCLEDEDGNSIVDSNNENRCTETNATGYYLFEGILPGNYLVAFTIPENTALTPSPQEGDDDTIDSNPIEENDNIAKASVSLELGDDIETIDMGLVYLGTASIGDFAWIDENKNGIFDRGEVGLDGMIVKLYDMSDNLLETIVTHNGGKYLFEHLNEGKYIVEFIIPDNMGYVFSKENIGSEEKDSDANVDTGRTKQIFLKEGEHISTVDAGVNCGCDSAPIKASGGDALGFISMILMIMMILFITLFFARKEEYMKKYDFRL